MDIQQMISVGIGVSIILLFWFLCRDFICKIIERVFLGLMLIFVVNIMIPQYAVGFNWITIGCAGALGVPGVTTLYIVNALI